MVTMETIPQMRVTKRLGIAVLIVLFSLLIVHHLIVNSSASGLSQYQVPNDNPLAWLSDSLGKSVAPNPENTPEEVMPADASASNGLDSGNSTLEGFQWLHTWNHMKQLSNISNGLPHANEAIDNARTAWENLTISIHNSSSKQIERESQCPYSIRRMNASTPDNGAFTIDIPCGLVVGSSVTIIGTPGSLSGNFRIDLVGTKLPAESGKPIVLHYNVRLTSDELTGGPVIVQNAFTASNGWGYEDRCPCSNSNNATEVDDLEQCNSMVGREEKGTINSKHHLNTKKSNNPSTYFPFKQGHLAISTLQIGLQGIHMTVDEKHITSFAYRAGLEPCFVTEVRVSGDFKLVSAIASGLPTSEDLENSFNLPMLKSSPITERKDVDLLIGIFSRANNFKRRMAIRRTWMQYDAVSEGVVVVRFFVGHAPNLAERPCSFTINSKIPSPQTAHALAPSFTWLWCEM